MIRGSIHMQSLTTNSSLVWRPGQILLSLFGLLIKIHVLGKNRIDYWLLWLSKSVREINGRLIFLEGQISADILETTVFASEMRLLRRMEFARGNMFNQ